MQHTDSGTYYALQHQEVDASHCIIYISTTHVVEWAFAEQKHPSLDVNRRRSRKLEGCRR